MKYALLALLVLFNPMMTLAQKDIFWADGGMSLARLNAGASITYNYNLSRYFGLGAGAQVYDFHATMVNFQPVPALFWDLRFNIRSRQKSQYFLFLDAGLNIYKHNTEYWVDGLNQCTVRDDNGSYTGFGFGYFRSQTARGWGHYASLKMISNHYTADAISTVSGAQGTETWGDETFVISFGFKF